RSVGGLQRADIGVDDRHVKLLRSVRALPVTIPWQAAAETKTGSGAADLSLPANGKAAQARHGKRQRLSGLRINTRSEIMINFAVRAHFRSIRKRIVLGA
ncbi:MAG TPA: hypothetical protein VKY80_05285, partial [Croceibacterium sp.]|nr:hypothetical protein [Croceibacterium sp.]